VSATTTPTAGIRDGSTELAADTFIHWLDDPKDPNGDLGALGGKAASLVRLMRAGLPVPSGFVILPDAFESISEGSSVAVHVSPRAGEHIRQAYIDLSRRLGQDDPAVAVRSSASAEDLPGASFAGQYDTYLGVRGADEVLGCASRCATSLWSPAATAYRRRLEDAGTTLPNATMAVIVQALVDAGAAGVAFTADPITGESQQVIVNASWGLGQSIVDGEVEGDSWRIDRASLHIVQETIGLKASRTGVSPDAPRQAVPQAEQRRRCLTPEQVATVARLALQAERVLDRPADVEWALADGQVYVLQARPITALPGPTPAELGTEPASHEQGSTPTFPFKWPEPSVAGLHWRREGGAGAAPARPWDEDEREANNRARCHAAELLGGERFRQTIYLNGYRYSREVPLPIAPEERERRRQAFQGPADALHTQGLTYWEVVLLPEIEAGDRRLAEVELGTLAPPALAAHLEEAIGWYERLWTLHSVALQTLRGQPGTLRYRLASLYKEISGRESAEETDAFLICVPNKLTEAIDGLIDLAGTVQSYVELRRLFETETPETVLSRLPETAAGVDFQRKFDRLLQEQALRSDAGAFTVRAGSQPGWQDRPSLVIALVQRYVPQDLSALARAHEASVAARDAQVETLRSTIEDESVRQQFDRLLDGARREARGYEDHNYYIDCAAGALLHRAVAASGRCLAAADCLASADDVFWLHLDEITSALRGLDGDAAPDRAPAWKVLVQARQSLHQWQRSLTPPDWLGAPSPAESSSATAPSNSRPGPANAPATEALPEPPSLLVKGQPGSSGVVTGRVRLVPRDALVPEVEPGDVLVAHNAGVLWTPVFPVAAAVVLDEGALFQHAMLTCREYRVPGVFQTKQATSVLQEGQRVTVDGTHGWVLPAET
jgi:rifampicin phosphotransferase